MNTRVAWYARRLASMSLGEIAWRAAQFVQMQMERLPFRKSQDMCWTNTLLQFRHTPLVRALWQNRQDLLDLLENQHSSGKQATLRAAEQLVQHQLELFGVSFDMGQTIRWNRDPRTLRAWPNVHWADIDIRDTTAIGGVKWVWQLNRHHHLVTLGKAYFLSGDERYASEVCAQLDDWISANPPRCGINWTSPLEMAIRIMNWSWALALMQPSPALTESLFDKVTESVLAQTGHIVRHMSAYSSANNHLIGEAAGLAFVSLCYPWLPHASAWQDKGLTILTREIERQLYADGTPTEQAVGYLAFDLECYILIWRLLQLNELEPPALWRDRLGAACEFLKHLMDDMGNVPAIGDSDDGQVVRLDDRSDASIYRSILASVAIMLRRPDLKAAAGQLDEMSLWLFGADGHYTFAALPLMSFTVGSRLFAQGGYGVMRAQRCIVTFDCGPLGYLSTAAHGHADALSITVSSQSMPLLVDPGTYAYHEGGPWRDYLRGTSAHNTVVIDQENQSEILGTFLWGRRATAQLLRWKESPEYDVAVAQHDGYRRRKVIHRRTVVFIKPDWIIILDRLLGQGRHHFEQLWHFPSECQLSLDSQLVSVAVGNRRFALMLPPGEIARAQILLGEKQPIQGWVSDRYGHISAAPVLALRGQRSLPLQMATIVSLRPEALEQAKIPSDYRDLTATALKLEQETSQ